MVSTLVKCGHPATSIYLDIDELRCRDCGSSLSFPARAPGPGDRADQLRDRRITQGEAHRVYVPMESLDDLDDTDDSTGGHYRRRRYPEASCIRCKVKLDLIPDPANSGRVECGRCDQVLVLIDADGQHRLPPFTPPRILPCACCKSMLPPYCFSRQAKMLRREGRNSTCRGCVAFRSRVRREQRSDEIRERDRLRMAEYWERAKADGRQRPPADKAATAAATQRHRARKEGRGVLLQRRGKSPILLKPVCRVAMTCPLAPYCVDKVAAGRAVLGSKQLWEK